MATGNSSSDKRLTKDTSKRRANQPKADENAFLVDSEGAFASSQTSPSSSKHRELKAWSDEEIWNEFCKGVLKHRF